MQIDLSVLILMGSLFTSYLLGVRLLEAITARLQSIKFISPYTRLSLYR